MRYGAGHAAGGVDRTRAPVNHAPVSERRTTTVLFGDLVSFTTLSESRDPEEVRELLSAYFAVARTVVGRYGGTIEKFIGDAVMAVWGVPVSHEDDAERAVRAGLDLITEVAALGESAGAPDLALRVGIVTGSVAVTLGASNEGMVAGDAVNTAARVQTAAAPGTVWVDQETRGLTEAAVAFSDMGEHVLKGKVDPVRLFRADMVVASVGGAQRVDGLQAPMTGRDAELRSVKELFHATETDGRARLAVVSGIAGIGKSRLGWEFDTYTDGLSTLLAWHRGRCLSYGEGVAFWAFAEMMRSRLRIHDGDDRSAVEEKTRVGVEKVAASADEAAWLTPRLTTLVSGGGRGSFERTDLFAAWATFLERVAGEAPIVLLFEDVQHADDALLDLIEHLVRTIRAKLFVLLLCRPELLERRPSLLTGRSSTLLELTPLPDPAMVSLLDALVHDLPARARDALATRAEGVPLYAVETVRSLIDRDAVVAREGRYVFVDRDHQLVDLDHLSAPTSLQTLIAARLDTLTALERRTVQDAAVLGVSFRYGGLLAIADVSSYDLDVAVDGLVAKGVLEAREDPASSGSGEYRFLQALVREVAYSTLARADRRARHLAAAAHLERAAEDAPEMIAGIVAQHLLDALAASPERDPQRLELARRARRSLLLAATAAEALGSPEQALSRTQAALALDPDPLEQAQLEESAARAAMQAGRYAVGEEMATRAMAGYEAHAAPADVVRVLSLQSRLAMRLGRPSEAAELAERGQGIADGVADVPLEVLCQLHWNRCSAAYSLGSTHEQMEHVLAGLRLAEELQDPVVLLRGLGLLSLALTGAGVRSGQRAVSERCIVLARDGHHLRALADALTGLCSDLYSEDLMAASRLAMESVAVARQLGEHYATEIGLTNACYIWWLTGDWDRLLAETADWLTGGESSVTSAPLWLTRALVPGAAGSRWTRRPSRRPRTTTTGRPGQR